MSISIDAAKAFDKIQNLFMIKALSKLGIDENFLSLMKNIHSIPTADILNGEKLGAFSLRSRTRQGCCPSPLLFSMAP